MWKQVSPVTKQVMKGWACKVGTRAPSPMPPPQPPSGAISAKEGAQAQDPGSPRILALSEQGTFLPV